MAENTLPQVDKNTRNINPLSSYCEEYFQDYVVGMAAAGNALPVTTDATYNVLHTRSSAIFAANIETQTLLAPIPAATGLDIAGDATAGDGYELNLNYPGNTNAKFLFTVGTDKPFFLEVKATVADISGAAELLFGFRKNEAFAKARATYTDYAYIGNIGAKIETATDLANAGETLVDSTQTLADATAVIYRVEVDSVGKVRMTFAKPATSTTLALPTVTQEYTFATGTVVIPSIRMIQHADITGTCIINYIKCGYMAA